jgi:hypothetical protein
LRPRLTTSLPLSSTWLIGTPARHLIRRNYGNCHLRIGGKLPHFVAPRTSGTLRSVSGHLASRWPRGERDGPVRFATDVAAGRKGRCGLLRSGQAGVAPAFTPGCSASSATLSGAWLSREPTHRSRRFRFRVPGGVSAELAIHFRPTIRVWAPLCDGFTGKTLARVTDGHHRTLTEAGRGAECRRVRDLSGQPHERLAPATRVCDPGPPDADQRHRQLLRQGERSG